MCLRPAIQSFHYDQRALMVPALVPLEGCGPPWQECLHHILRKPCQINMQNSEENNEKGASKKMEKKGWLSNGRSGMNELRVVHDEGYPQVKMSMFVLC